MTRQEIIGIINEVVPSIKTDIFRDDGGPSKIGSNQFRDLANLCKHSECYDEIEMLIRYNEAKVKAKRVSWASPMKNSSMTFADIIIGCMKRVKEASADNEQCLNDLSMFFGYFYWNARIWSAENKDTQRRN